MIFDIYQCYWPRRVELKLLGEPLIRGGWGSDEVVAADGAVGFDFGPAKDAGVVEDVQVGAGEFDDLFLFHESLEADGALAATGQHLCGHFGGFGEVGLGAAFAEAEVEHGEGADDGRDEDDDEDGQYFWFVEEF